MLSILRIVYYRALIFYMLIGLCKKMTLLVQCQGYMGHFCDQLYKQFLLSLKNKALSQLPHTYLQSYIISIILLQ